MRARSCGLETSITLNVEEMRNIGKGGVEGMLVFREVLENTTKEIPFSLNYCPNQREPAEVVIFPEETYFGNAEKLNFLINSEYYGWLLSSGRAEGARFLTNGKLNLLLKGVNRTSFGY